ncbi:MAG: thiol protease/hemagglutinin PrtT [Bacteroidetes bacterium]|nr:thiol protease/hemagglutinin PrtT [Bacteroidota bacterium]
MKKALSIALFALCVYYSYATPVKESEALSIASHYISHQKGLSTLSGTTNLQTAYTQKFKSSDLSFKNAFYVFSINNNNGFVMVAADDNINPIIGYSNEGGFDTTNMPEHFTALLNQYTQEIQYVIENSIQSSATKQKWQSILSSGAIKYGQSQQIQSSVAPLVKTKWTQRNDGYNKLCPGNTPTGCVATAFAQTLKYWNYPEQGWGQNSYNHDYFGTIGANFGATKYDWTNMPNKLTSSSSTAQKDAIAKLMYHCGIAININYNKKSSLAYFHDVATALKKYFGYSSTTQYIERTNYTELQWINLVKTELNNSRVAILGGRSADLEYGHAFVVDGYDQNDLFHINWGWGGLYDGYFQISNLQPGGNGHLTWNDYQNLTIGIKPKNLNPAKLQIVSKVSVPTSIKYSTSTLIAVQIKNYGTTKITGSLAARLFDNKNVFAENLSTLNSISINPGATTTLYFSSAFVNVVPADYRLGIYFKNATTPSWQLIANASYGTYPYNLEVRAFNDSLAVNSSIKTSPSGNFTKGKSCSVSATIKNWSTQHFNGQVRASLYDLYGDFIKDIQIKTNVSINAGASKSLNFNTSSINVPPGTYYIIFRSLSNTTNSNWQFVGATTGNNKNFKPSIMKTVVLPYTNSSKTDEELQEETETSYEDELLALHIYPNPATSNIFIQLPEEMNNSYDCEIVNMNGQVVHKLTISGGMPQPIDIREIPKGVYFIRAIIAGKAVTQKFIKTE